MSQRQRPDDDATTPKRPVPGRDGGGSLAGSRGSGQSGTGTTTPGTEIRRGHEPESPKHDGSSGRATPNNTPDDGDGQPG